MKILKLDLLNIHSLKGPNSIDFNNPPLSQTGIFAIVGATGSGKSTLLDVIMLALYGQIPRYDKRISVDDVQNLGTVLTKGTEKGFAQVEYSTHNKLYRSKWYIEKKRKNYSYSMELSQLPNEKIIEEKKSEVPKRNEQIIGLNYNQFLKSIVLAQGNFAKFLKANPEERTLMLEKITGTEIYRLIGQRAFEITRNFSNKLKEKENLLSQFDTLTDQKRYEIKVKIKQLEQNINFVDKNISIFDEKIHIKKQIKQINQNITDLKSKLNQINKKIVEYKPTIEKLETHKKISEYKTQIFEVNDLNNTLNEINLKIDKYNQEKVDIESNINEKLLEKEKKQNSLNNIQLKVDNAQQYICKAEDLSQKIGLKQQNFEHKKNDLLKLQKNEKFILDEIQQNKEQIIKFQSERDSTEKWLIKNKILENLKTDYVIIEQLFDSYEKAKSKISDAIEQSSLKNYFSQNNLKQYPQIVQNIINNLHYEINKIKLDEDIEIENLKLKKDNLFSEIEYIDRLVQIAEFYNKDYKQTQKLQSEKQIFNDDLQNYEQKRKKTENELEITSKNIEELQKKYEKEQLEAKYEQDRLKLKNNEPCPLCGAVHHPYVDKNQKVKIDFTKKLIDKRKKLKSDLDKNLQLILSKISSIKTSIENNDKQIYELNENIEKYNQNSINIQNNISEKFKLKEVEKIEEYRKKLLDDKTKLQKIISDAEKYSKFNNQLINAQYLLEKINELFDFNEKSRNKLKPYLNYYKGNNKPDNILESLKNYMVKFDEKTQKINDIKTNLKTKQAIVDKNNSQIENLQTDIKKAETDLNNAKNSLLENKNNLEQIIKNKLENLKPKKFTETYNTKISDLKDNLSVLEKKIAELNARFSEIEKNISNLMNEFKKKTDELNTKESDLLVKLKKLQIKTVDQAAKNLLQKEKVQEIEKNCQKFNNEQISINQSLQDYKKNLINLKQKDDDTTIEQCQTELNRLKNHQKQINRDCGSYKNMLENDNLQRDKKIKLKKEFDEINNEFKKWDKLNYIIGDAKGKRFAEIAQQFTLTELILLANNHLKKFSNRYILDKTSDTKNNLFVYDTFMGMTKRSVHTLSGGETFLVSMSLALALSDLASRKTKIESLFIDEGFGSLDEQTLDKALVNLEKLHSDYNRTIGIISHVPDIKERINTKILIQKNNSGYSKIDIIN